LPKKKGRCHKWGPIRQFLLKNYADKKSYVRWGQKDRKGGKKLTLEKSFEKGGPLPACVLQENRGGVPKKIVKKRKKTQGKNLLKRQWAWKRGGASNFYVAEADSGGDGSKNGFKIKVDVGGLVAVQFVVKEEERGGTKKKG